MTPHIRIPHDALRSTTSPAIAHQAGMAWLLYEVLLGHADYQTGIAHPSQAILAKECATTERNIRLRLKRLKDLGYIFEKQRGANRQSAQYIILTPQEILTSIGCHAEEDFHVVTSVHVEKNDLSRGRILPIHVEESFQPPLHPPIRMKKNQGEEPEEKPPARARACARTHTRDAQTPQQELPLPDTPITDRLERHIEVIRTTILRLKPFTILTDDDRSTILDYWRSVLTGYEAEFRRSCNEAAIQKNMLAWMKYPVFAVRAAMQDHLDARESGITIRSPVANVLHTLEGQGNRRNGKKPMNKAADLSVRFWDRMTPQEQADFRASPQGRWEAAHGITPESKYIPDEETT